MHRPVRVSAVTRADGGGFEDQLRLAAVNRTAIGQAQGILMERFAIDANRAFDLLRRVSQTNNTKLLEIATTVVSTRRVPGVPS